MASASEPDFKPSSSATSASASRAVSTISRREGSRPNWRKPAWDGRPSSCASTRGQHHNIQLRLLFSDDTCAMRLSARRKAKPRLAIQVPAIAPGAEASPLISCRLSASRPEGKSVSASRHPSRQPPSAASGPAPKGDARSIPRTLSRKASSSCWRARARASPPGSGTAKGKSAVPAGPASLPGLTWRDPRGGGGLRGEWAA